jgi:single stranded DNA-binding protein
MANDINKVILTGNIGKKPIEKVLESGSSYVSFSLAVGESYKKGDEWINNTHWVYCRCWYSSIQKKALELGKGAKVCVEGSLNVYRPKEGNTITSVKVSRLIGLIKKPDVEVEDTPQDTPQEPSGETEVPF